MDDTIIEKPGTDGGIDSIFAVATFSLAGYGTIENLRLNIGNINGTGNNLANEIIGNIGNNYIDGVTGNDQLYGREGNDTLLGGSGADTLTGGMATIPI